MTDDADARLTTEAIRLYRRYAIEAVEALGLCPYAERARLDGHTRELVITARTPTDEQVYEKIEAAADDPAIEIGLVIFPRLELSQPGLGRWVEVLRKGHAARHDGRAVLAIEGFHPAGRLDTSTAERLTPFVRRTPDPTLQLTRLTVLDRVRRGTPSGTAFLDPSDMNIAELLASSPKASLHERIADANLRTVIELGSDVVAARFDELLRDRDAAYAAIDPTIVRRLGPG